MRTVVVALIASLAASAAAAQVPPKAAGAIRFATFNASLNERQAGGIVRRLESRVDRQARKIAEVVQRVRPDVLLLQELDRDPALRSLALIQEYFARGENGAEGIAYPHAVFPPSNTGVPAGVDLDGDGVVTLPNDALGFGHHEGQYAFALLSRLPLGEALTYGDILWRDMPGNLMPRDYYSEAAQAVLPLSSKTHLSVPVETPAGSIRVLAAHPTPPVFDDARDWNGRRNSDEIRLLADMLAGPGCSWIDNEALTAALRDSLAGLPDAPPESVAAGERLIRSNRMMWRAARGQTPFPACPDVAAGRAVVMGDLNADPTRGDALPYAIEQLLLDDRIYLDRRVADPLDPAVPRSAAHGDITADFNGGMRVDYVLPTRDLEVTGSGVFWPADGDPLARLNDASDHHLVWVDVRVR